MDMDSKNFFASKTLWVNVLALIAMFAQARYGWVMSPEWQAGALAAINFILRIVTRQPVSWS